MDNNFEIGGRKFKLGKIDAFRQFHVVRRIGPLLVEVMPAIQKAASTNMEVLSEAQKLDKFAELLQPVLEGLSRLSDADADYVLFRLLGAVEVQQPEFNVWAKIATDTGLLMQDIELPVLLQAAGRSLMYNLSGFFALLPRK